MSDRQATSGSRPADPASLFPVSDHAAAVEHDCTEVLRRFQAQPRFDHWTGELQPWKEKALPELLRRGRGRGPEYRVFRTLGDTDFNRGMFMNSDGAPAAKVEQIFGSPDSTPVTDELQRLTNVLQSLCPKESVIKFEFDGKLHLHIDLRRFEDMTTVEALLPTACGGVFHSVQRGMAEKHSFFHRLTAIVAR